MTISDGRSIAMGTPFARRVALGAVVLMVTGCASSLYERGSNPRGLSQREVERDYNVCNHFPYISVPLTRKVGPPKIH